MVITPGVASRMRDAEVLDGPAVALSTRLAILDAAIGEDNHELLAPETIDLVAAPASRPKGLRDLFQHAISLDVAIDVVVLFEAVYVAHERAVASPKPRLKQSLAVGRVEQRAACSKCRADAIKSPWHSPSGDDSDASRATRMAAFDP